MPVGIAVNRTLVQCSDVLLLGRAHFGYKASGEELVLSCFPEFGRWFVVSVRSPASLAHSGRRGTNWRGRARCQSHFALRSTPPSARLRPGDRLDDNRGILRQPVGGAVASCGQYLPSRSFAARPSRAPTWSGAAARPADSRRVSGRRPSRWHHFDSWGRRT